jgi:hypothetical protein
LGILVKSKLLHIVIIVDIILGVLFFWLNASYGVFTKKFSTITQSNPTQEHLIDVSSTIPGHTITLTDKNGLESIFDQYDIWNYQKYVSSLGPANRFEIILTSQVQPDLQELSENGQVITSFGMSYDQKTQSLQMLIYINIGEAQDLANVNKQANAYLWNFIYRSAVAHGEQSPPGEFITNHTNSQSFFSIN